MPLFLEAAKPLYPLRRDDTGDIGQVARAKASGDRQFHRPVEFFLFPLLLDPVAGHRFEPSVRPTAATAFAEQDLPESAAPGRSQCFASVELFSDAMSLCIHGRAFGASAPQSGLFFFIIPICCLLVNVAIN